MDRPLEEIELSTLDGNSSSKIAENLSAIGEDDSIGLHCVGYKMAYDKARCFLLVCCCMTDILLIFTN